MPVKTLVFQPGISPKSQLGQADLIFSSISVNVGFYKKGS